MNTELSELEKRMAKLSADLTEADIRPYVPVIQALGLTDQRRRFSTGTAPDGRRWAPLKAPRPVGGNMPLRNYGLLAASVVSKVVGNELIVGTNLAYAGVHQFGGTITPKRGKFLAMPLTVEAYRWGSPRFPRPFPRPLVPIMRPGKNRGVLGEYTDSGFVAHYALIPKATIPARPFLGFSSQFGDELGDLWADILARKIQAAFKG